MIPKLIEVVEEELKIPEVRKVVRYSGRLFDLTFFHNYVGIDPGDRNMGVAVLEPPSFFSAYEITFEDADDMVERISDAVGIVTRIVSIYKAVRGSCVERAAFSKLYGQVALAENRTAAVMGLMMLNLTKVLIPAPGTIRKVVFGNGKIRSEDVWPNLGPDAASALACALYAEATK